MPVDEATLAPSGESDKIQVCVRGEGWGGVRWLTDTQPLRIALKSLTPSVTSYQFVPE